MIKRKAKAIFVYAPTGKRYEVGDVVDIPEDKVKELVQIGMVEEFVVEKKVKPDMEIKQATIKPEEYADLKKKK